VDHGDRGARFGLDLGDGAVGSAGLIYHGLNCSSGRWESDNLHTSGRNDCLNSGGGGISLGTNCARFSHNCGNGTDRGESGSDIFCGGGIHGRSSGSLANRRRNDGHDCRGSSVYLSIGRARFSYN